MLRPSGAQSSYKAELLALVLEAESAFPREIIFSDSQGSLKAVEGNKQRVLYKDWVSSIRKEVKKKDLGAIGDLDLGRPHKKGGAARGDGWSGAMKIAQQKILTSKYRTHLDGRLHLAFQSTATALLGADGCTGRSIHTMSGTALRMDSTMDSSTDMYVELQLEGQSALDWRYHNTTFANSRPYASGDGESDCSLLRVRVLSSKEFLREETPWSACFSYQSP